jgi:hypothetical protein
MAAFTMTDAEYRAYMVRTGQALPAVPAVIHPAIADPVVSKFNAIRCEVDGERFQSKLARKHYEHLVMYREAGEIDFFLREVPFPLPGRTPSGRRIVHRLDWLVVRKGVAIFAETKGRDLEQGRMKRSQVEELYKIRVHVWTKKTGVELPLN